MLKAFGAFMEIGWLMPLVGLAEIVGGLLIIIPRTRALGALIIFPVMVGIFLTNIVQDKSGLPLAFIFAVLLCWIMYENREKYLPIISKTSFALDRGKRNKTLLNQFFLASVRTTTNPYFSAMSRPMPENV